MRRRRPLSDNERAVLQRLLVGEFPGADAFRAQLHATTVSGICPCGCGRLDLSVDRDKAPRACGPEYDDGDGFLIVENAGPDSLMIMQKGGWLTELEHLSGVGESPQMVDPSKVHPDPWAD